MTSAVDVRSQAASPGLSGGGGVSVELAVPLDPIVTTYWFIVMKLKCKGEKDVCVCEGQ